MENKQLSNNGCHGDQGVRAHTSQATHSLVTVVFVQRGYDSLSHPLILRVFVN